MIFHDISNLRHPASQISMVDLAKICQDHGETYLKLLLFNNTASPTLMFLKCSAIGRIPLCTKIAFTGVTSQVIWITISLNIYPTISDFLDHFGQAPTSSQAPTPNPSRCGSPQCHHCHTQMMKIWQPSIKDKYPRHMQTAAQILGCPRKLVKGW